MAIDRPVQTKSRVLIDTNIVLDIFDPERPCHDDALALLWYTTEESAPEIVASISSFKDAYYILCKLYKDEGLARRRIRSLVEGVICPVDLAASYGSIALDCDEPDFEDALIRITAEQENVRAIITRDKRAFTNSTIAHMSAGEYLAQQGFSYEVIDL